MKQLLNIGKYVGAIAATVTAVWAVFTMYDNLKDQNSDTQGMVVDLWEQQLIFEEEVTVRLNSIEDTMRKTNKKIDENTEIGLDNRRMFRYEMEHRDEFTPEQMREILDEFIKKNDPLSLRASDEIPISDL
jgi:hypothetical protein